MVTVVTSLENPTVKLARALGRRRDRQRERAFVLEGVRALSEALAAGAVPRAVLLDRDSLGNGEAQDHLLVTLTEVRSAGAGRHMRLLEVSTPVLKSVSETETPQGIAAIMSFPEQREPATGTPLIVVADGIRDPGNLGTMLRTALGAGVTAFYTTPETVDLYNPKVVRAAMGAHFRLPLRSNVGWSMLDEALAGCDAIWGTAVSGAADYASANWAQPAALIIGNEDRGISDGARTRCTGLLTIPLANHLESLNAAVASAVVLFEAARQRRSDG